MTDQEQFIDELNQKQVIYNQRSEVDAVCIDIRVAALLRQVDVEGDISKGGTLAEVVNWTRSMVAADEKHTNEVSIIFDLDGTWMATTYGKK